MNMLTKKRGLGRGLSDLGLGELLSDIKKIDTVSIQQNEEIKAENGSILRKLPIDILQPGKYQPRQEFDQAALDELANSIRSQGIIQPIVVRSVGINNYEIIAGERRWRAAQMAGLQEVPTVIRDISDEQAIAMSLIENIQRENLNSIDAAMGLQRLIDEFGMTHQDAAAAVGKSRVTVTNLLRLLGLNEEVKRMVQKSDLEMGHARALLSLDLGKQLQAAKTIVAKSLSVRSAETLVQNLLQDVHNANAKIQKHLDPNVTKLQLQLRDKLGAEVFIKHAQNGKGKLIIQYNSLDELDGILGHIA